MTDEELIARLREHDGWVTLEAHTHLTAADRIEELEAKLAKAVDALDMLVRDCEADYPPSHGAIKHFAIATLAELKGESHE